MFASAPKILLVGFPNSGKTTLFNWLTGSNEKVGNWPGVTVNCTAHLIESPNGPAVLHDLPGTYSLSLSNTGHGKDEQIALDFLLHLQCDLIINVCEATHLSRQLYFTLQLLELGLPVVLVLNRIDELAKKGLILDVPQLQARLGCPIVLVDSPEHLDRLTPYLTFPPPRPTLNITYPAAIDHARQTLHFHLPSTHIANLDLLLLEDEGAKANDLAPELIQTLATLRKQIEQTCGEEVDILIANARYCFVADLIKDVTTPVPEKKPNYSQWLDRIFLHRGLGIPLFLAMTYFLFFLVMNIGGLFQDSFDLLSLVSFVDWPTYWMHQWGWPDWSIAILAEGVGSGLNTIASFIPVLAIMFFLLAFLENSGYMARAAFVMDRGMRILGLSGKSFVPFLIGFGCNVPAVFATRTLEEPRDRILTILMTPFMSCSARLAIYAVFTGAFFKSGGQNIVFLLYFIGIGMAVFTGVLLQKCWFKSTPSPLIMELPPYHWPKIRELLKYSNEHLISFIRRASPVIILACMILQAAQSIDPQGHLLSSATAGQSILAVFGQWVTPILHPIGITNNNWPATVALITGVMAKEVVIATLNSLYSTTPDIINILPMSLNAALLQAGQSLLENLSNLHEAIFHPLSSITPTETMSPLIYGEMHRRFDGTIPAFSYLVFILLYYPCIATSAAISRELNRRMAVFSVLWSLWLAYATAVLFYQIATINQHRIQTFCWILGIGISFGLIMFGLKYFGHRLLGKELKHLSPSINAKIDCCGH